MKRNAILIVLCAAAIGLAGSVPYSSGAAQHNAPKKQLIQAKGSGALQLPFSPGLMVGDTLYLSGGIGADASGQLVAGGIEPEMRQIFANAQALLGAAGMDLSDVVSVTVYLADIQDFAKMNTVYKEYFKAEPLPTRSTVAVKDLVRGARLEIAMTAARTSK